MCMCTFSNVYHVVLAHVMHPSCTPPTLHTHTTTTSHPSHPQAFQLSTWALCLATGLWMTHSGIPLAESLAFIPLGLSLLDSCWLAHDYIHGRGPWCSAMRNFGGWAAGFSATMWSNKHNMHHAATNEMGRDEDLSSGPLLWLWAPDPRKDKPWRR